MYDRILMTYWKTTALEEIKNLVCSATCDVIIIGAGIVGLSAAVELIKLG